MIRDLKFDDQGLITAVIQDNKTGEVLMVAHMNKDSLAETLRSGETWFWSRSRKELWHKGATSGNTQKVIDIKPDCDGDVLLLRVEPNGPACHTGSKTCFDTESNSSVTPTFDKRDAQLSVVNVAAMDLGILLQDLYNVILERKDQRPEGSYTTYLFNSGIDKILKKIGEEAAETIIAAKNADKADGKQQLSSEISDLLYHLVVLMVDRDVKLEDVLNVLQKRKGKK